MSLERAYIRAVEIDKKKMPYAFYLSGTCIFIKKMK